MFVTSQGSAYARFRRALDTGSPVVALAAAKDLRQIGAHRRARALPDHSGRSGRYARAVARWIARFATEGRCVTGSESAVVLALLPAIRGPTTATGSSPGDDLLDPGTGRDRARGNAGMDRFRARDFRRDILDGGAGQDRATIDPRDYTTRIETIRLS